MYIESIIHTYNNSTTVWSRPSIYCITTVPTPSWVKDKSHEETKHGKSMLKLSAFGLVLHFR